MKCNKRKILAMFCVVYLAAVMALTVSASEKASLKLNKSELTLYVGDTYTLKPTVTGKSDKVTWKSSSKSVATVSNGKIKAKKAGKTTITAKANGKTRKCVVTVKRVPAYVKAYKKLLSKSTIGTRKWPASQCSFAFAYIDNNSVPELVIQSYWSGSMFGYYEIYTYRNGKARRIDVNLGVSFEYYKKTGVLSDSYWYTHPQGGPGSRTTYYKLKNGKITATLSKVKLEPNEMYNREKTVYNYNLNSKSIKKSKYNTQLKKLTGSKKAVTPAFYKNTAANRKKYIK